MLGEDLHAIVKVRDPFWALLHRYLGSFDMSHFVHQTLSLLPHYQPLLQLTFSFEMESVTQIVFIKSERRLGT